MKVATVLPSGLPLPYPFFHLWLFYPLPHSPFEFFLYVLSSLAHLFFYVFIIVVAIVVVVVFVVVARVHSIE